MFFKLFTKWISQKDRGEAKITTEETIELCQIFVFLNKMNQKVKRTVCFLQIYL